MDLESRVSALERATSNIPLRVPLTSGASGFTWITVDTRAHLPTTGIKAPALAYTTSDFKYYAWSNGAWIGISHLL